MIKIRIKNMLRKEMGMKNKTDQSTLKAEICPLTPNSNLNSSSNEYKTYEGYLDAAFDNEEIRNIAVSGSYGIGKSSIVRTFERNSRLNFMYISLMDCLKDNDRIEITLLRQILTNCVRKNFSRLRFRMTPEEMNKFPLKLISLCAYICLLICVLFSERISDVFHLLIKKDLSGYGTPILYLVFLIATFVLIFVIVFYGLKYFKIKEINLKLSKENAEAESGASSCEESVLDEYRFDLIYVLENLSKDYNAIIFEDMDRLDSEKCISVFHQLREINLSLNARNKKKKNFPFRFLYVVNDELMEKINQTKFFDYIMSVVPSLGIANAKDKFQYVILDELNVELNNKEKECIFNAIDASIMLKDYRTLNQIKNDYNLFSSIAKETGVAIENCKGILLGFVIYKVLWPQDYHLIRSGKSLVFPKWEDDKDKIDKEVESRNGNIKITHKEYDAIKEIKNLLTNNVCLKFIGYSKKELCSYYKDTLKSNSVDKKKELLSNDDDFICGVILFDSSDSEISMYINGLENEFILYLVRFYYSDCFQKYNFEKFIDNLTNIRNDMVSAAFVSEVENELNKLNNAGDAVEAYIFVVRCFLKLGYHVSDSTDKNAYRWFYHSDSDILKERMKLLDSLKITDSEYRALFSNFSMSELADFYNATSHPIAKTVIKEIWKKVTV